MIYVLKFRITDSCYNVGMRWSSRGLSKQYVMLCLLDNRLSSYNSSFLNPEIVIVVVIATMRVVQPKLYSSHQDYYLDIAGLNIIQGFYFSYFLQICPLIDKTALDLNDYRVRCCKVK